MMRSLNRALRAFRRDDRGVSAVEFALVAPLGIALYFGLAELSQGLSAKRRISHAASAIGDLVAQTNTAMTMDELDKVFDASRTLVQPFPTDTLGLRVTSVTADSQGVPKVDWSDVDGAGLSRLPKGGKVTLPAGLLTASGDTVIMAEATYTYKPVVAVATNDGLKFNEKFYLRPRILSKVSCTNCPAQ